MSETQPQNSSISGTPTKQPKPLSQGQERLRETPHGKTGLRVNPTDEHIPLSVIAEEIAEAMSASSALAEASETTILATAAAVNSKMEEAPQEESKESQGSGDVHEMTSLASRRSRRQTKKRQILEPEMASTKRSRCQRCSACRAPLCGKCESCLSRFDDEIPTLRRPCIQRMCIMIHGSPGKGVAGKTDPPVAAATAANSKQKIAEPSIFSSVAPTSSNKKQRRNSAGSSRSNSRLSGQLPVSSSPTSFENPQTKNNRRSSQYYLNTKDEERTKPAASESQDDKNDKTLYYGRPRALPPALDVCAACQKAEPESVVVLLCDACPREYHLRCCGRHCVRIPPGDWYCVDCDPIGGQTRALQVYFEKHQDINEGREERWFRVIREDMEAQPWYQQAHPKSDSSPSQQSGKVRSPKSPSKAIGLPKSELQRIPVQPWSKKILTDSFSWIGQAVNLYVPAMNDYVVGRIVDERQFSDVLEHYVRFPAGVVGSKEPFHIWLVLEEHAVNVSIGLVLARRRGAHTKKSSPRGSPKKKRAVNDYKSDEKKEERIDPNTLDDSKWQPAFAWARSSRELVTLLSQAQRGQIQFYPPGMSPWSHEQPCRSSGKASSPNWKRGGSKSPPSPRSSKTLWVLIRFFGETEYTFMHLDDVLDFFDYHPRRPTGAQESNDESNRTRWTLAQAERLEQESIRQWRDLPQKSPWQHPTALVNRDLEKLPPLITQNAETVSILRPPSPPVESCPLIRTGLDRSHLVHLLRKQDVGLARIGKEFGATAECRSLSIIEVLRQKAAEQAQNV